MISRLDASRSAATNRVYQSRWVVFERFCRDRDINPWSASAPVVADFLLFCFHERNATPGTINGYKSAITARLKLASGVDLASNRQLATLVRSFFVERPVRARSVVHWDIALVLDYLKCGKLADTDSLLPRAITLKCVFLLALASGKRRGELHALENKILMVNGSWDQIILKPYAGFLSKTHTATRGVGTFKEIVIPSISGADQVHESDAALCPVRALRRYKTVSDAYRSSKQVRLIISYCKNRSTDISKQTISNYLKVLVMEAYEAAVGQPRPGQVRGHDIRAVAASLRAMRCCSMEELLASGMWSSMDTFLSYYAKSFSLDELTKLYSLSPFVVGQAVF